MDYIRPIITGLAAALVVYLLMRVGKRPAARVGNRRVLTYGLGFRIFSALLVPGSLFVTYAALHARPSQFVLALCIAGGFLLAAAFSTYQAFFVSFSYDDSNIYYSSPLAGTHTIAWSDIQEVGYSGLMQSHFIRAPQMSRIWCSSMLSGYEDLGEFLGRKHEELYGSR